ncbi:ABC transporter substrate-binding protein [Nocardia jinanensis]|uniref:ABC transporter substrate-binding protein n=1 Tax=Nocardia jinanensis TaxID=382504 RepID=A0A917VTH4_9NOCA|nr:ABC transporter substrate-binding protein [Nocardia jinanensis]
MTKVILAVVAAATLAASACGGGGNSPAATGEPRPGGAATFLVNKEPRTLDPATLSNLGPQDGALGNALYGQLVGTDPADHSIVPKLAQSLESKDGIEWTLTLRAGLTFSDGSPFDAGAVQFAWDRMKDPAVGALDGGYARTVAATEVTSPATLSIRLSEPTRQFGQTLATTAMNWIASPAAVEKGAAAFDANPIGAGPFTLDSWSRGGDIVLAKNPSYYDAPRPYLDRLTIRAMADQNQRLSTLQSGGADLILSLSAGDRPTAEAAGFVVTPVDQSGGLAFVLNNAAAPFDDIRARRAVNAALDLDALNDVRNRGNGTVPTSLFTETSPYHDPALGLPGHDPGLAQRLFDELAAEGKPVRFSILAYPTTENQRGAQAVQSQLSTFANVQVDVETGDYAAIGAKLAAGDYEFGITGINSFEPEPIFSRRLQSGSTANFAEVADPELDEALRLGRMATDEGQRTEAYRKLQERFIELLPMILYTRNETAVIAAPTVGGVALSGIDAPLVDTLWVTG